MWSDHEYDDDTFVAETEDLCRSERPKQTGHNITKTSQLYFAGLIPWYTSGFE